jgi:hypothetical protein
LPEVARLNPTATVPGDPVAALPVIPSVVSAETVTLPGVAVAALPDRANDRSGLSVPGEAVAPDPVTGMAMPTPRLPRLTVAAFPLSA